MLHKKESQPTLNFQHHLFYKIVPVNYQDKCISVDKEGKCVKIDNFQGQNRHIFSIGNFKQKYKMTNLADNSFLCILKNSICNLGEVVVSQTDQESNQFQIVQVSSVEKDNKVYIKTFCGKVLDYNNESVRQANFDGQPNQMWYFIQVEKKVFSKVESRQQVPLKFCPSKNEIYKILSIKDISKGFTIKNGGYHSLQIYAYVGNLNQKFKIIQKENKFAFICQSNNQGLKVFQNKFGNQLQFCSNIEKDESSWFTIVRNEQGEWAQKAYFIKSFEDRYLSLEKNDASPGNKIIQLKQLDNQGQMWLIIPWNQKVQKQYLNQYRTVVNNKNNPYSSLPKLPDFPKIEFPKLS